MTTFTLRTPDILGRSAFDHIFTNFFKDPDLMIRQSTEGYPLTDLYNDKEGNQVIEMALAGFRKDQINIEVVDNKITISSDIKKSAEQISNEMEDAFEEIALEKVPNLEHSKKTYRRRIAKRDFHKVFVDYGNQLDLENCEASFVDGLLRIIIRKDRQTDLKKIDII